MAMKLYVGNLPYGMSDSDLQNLFEQHGTCNPPRSSWIATQDARKVLASSK